MTTPKRNEAVAPITDQLYPEHGRTSCSDADPCNAEAAGSNGCARCTSIMLERVTSLQGEVSRLREALKYAERYCPCGARPESPITHPHIPGCLIDKALNQGSTNNG